MNILVLALQVVVGNESHVYVYEAGGMSVLGGVPFNVLQNKDNGELDLDELAAAIRCCMLGKSTELAAAESTAAYSQPGHTLQLTPLDRSAGQKISMQP